MQPHSTKNQVGSHLKFSQLTLSNANNDIPPLGSNRQLSARHGMTHAPTMVQMQGNTHQQQESVTAMSP